MKAEPTITKKDEGRTFGVVGDVYRFLVTGEETNGKYALWEAIVPPGGGPPPHRHSREEEGFFVLEGEIRITVDGRQLAAGPGTFVNLPPGTLHSFTNATDKSAKMLISVAPAGLEKMFVEIGQPLPAGTTSPSPPTPDEIEKLLASAARYGIEIQPPQH